MTKREMLHSLMRDAVQNWRNRTGLEDHSVLVSPNLPDRMIDLLTDEEVNSWMSQLTRDEYAQLEVSPFNMDEYVISVRS